MKLCARIGTPFSLAALTAVMAEISADGVDADGLNALFQQLLDGGHEGLEVAFAGWRLHVDGPAQLFALSGRAIDHCDVERAGQRRRDEANIHRTGGFGFRGRRRLGCFFLRGRRSRLRRGRRLAAGHDNHDQQQQQKSNFS